MDTTFNNCISVSQNASVPAELINDKFDIEPIIIQHGPSSFELFNMGQWSVMFPLTKIEKESLTKGQTYEDGLAHLIANRLPPINLDVAAYVLKYLQEVYEAIGTESSVFLMYNPTKGYQVFVPLQIDASGGSVTYITPLRGSTLPDLIKKEEEDVVNLYRETQKEFIALLKGGYRIVGTIHSHPNFNAFSSGIDDGDERSINGMHLTFGHINKEVFEVHGRLTLNKYRWDLDHSDMFENSLEEIMAAAAAIEIEEKYVDRCLERKQVTILTEVRNLAAGNGPRFWERSVDNDWLNDDIVALDAIDHKFEQMDIDFLELDDYVALQSLAGTDIILVEETDYWQNYQLFSAWNRVELTPKV